MNHAKEYLAKVLPWPQEDEAPAFVNIHWKTTKLTQKGKPLWSGRACRTVKEAVRTIEWALSLPDVLDIYVCMSTQATCNTQASKTTGKPYNFPIRSQENAVALKSFFIDIDAKGEDEDSYDTLEEALKAFAAFRKAVDLPKPNVVVQTGGGIHVYWTFERALTVQEWQPLAHAMVAAIKAHGFKCDTGCTIDSARILRVPDTSNRKLAIPRPVVLLGGRTGGDFLLARLERSLKPYLGATPLPKATPAPAWAAAFPPLPPITDGALASGIDRNTAPPINIHDVAKECPFIHEAVTSGGKGFANPLWNLTTLIATFLEGGRSDAHAMACGHADYVSADTDDLYDRKEKDRKAKSLGWPACRTISASGYAGCKACPHFVSNRSPLNYAATQLVPAGGASQSSANGTSGPSTGSFNDLPPGYTRSANGIISKILIAEDGSHILEPVSNYPMYDPSIQIYPNYTLNFTTTVESGRTTQIVVPTEHCDSKASFRRCLLRQGVALQEDDTKKLMRFFMSWVERLQQSKQMIVSSAPYGWSVDSRSNIEGFVFGGDCHMPTGKRTAANPDPVLVKRYKPTGQVDPWIAAAKLITDQKRPALDAIVASAFAAPLIRFCHEPGVLMSTYSTRSGIGKTTALKVAQAVWGHPIRAMQGLDDTQNSVIGKIGQIQNLPMYWDELKTEEDHRRFVKLAFSLARQKEKERMHQNATLRESGHWQTLLVSASNDSIMHFVVQQTKQTTAGMYRLFEYEVPPSRNGVGQIDQADASRIIGKLEDHYGTIGLAYANYLGSNYAAIEKDVEAFYKAVGAEIDCTAEERYWRVMVCVLLKGAEYANKLGFTNIDGIALKEFLFKVVEGLRFERKAQPVDLTVAVNVSNVLAQFLNAMRARHTLRTNKIHIGRGKPVKGSIKVQTPTDRLDAIRVHIGEDDRIVRISKTYFQDWLHDNGYSPMAIIKAMETEFSSVVAQGRMGSGTDFSGTIEYLIDIDLTKNNHVNFIDEA